METPKKKRLFVCVENSNLSQLSEAFARIHGVGWLKAFSAGSRPSGRINPKAIDSMKQLGYDLSTHRSNSLRVLQLTRRRCASIANWFGKYVLATITASSRPLEV